MSSIAQQGDSKQSKKKIPFFENNGVEFTIAVVPHDSLFRIIIRERKTNAFVKELGPMTQEQVEKIQSKISRFVSVVYLYDIFDMRLLDAIEQYVANYGQTPTYATLAMRLQATYTEVALGMKRLEKKGFIETSFHNKKGFKILRHRRDA